MVEHTAFPVEDHNEQAPIIYVTEVLVEDTHNDDSSTGSNNEWACRTCTLLNPVHNNYCEACENPGPLIHSHQEVSQTPSAMVFDEKGNELQDRNALKTSGAYYAPDSNNIEEAEVEEVVDLGESPWAKKMRRRRRRKGRVCVGAVGGAVVGGILGCGIGAIAGAAVGGIAVRRFSKSGERKKDEQLACITTVATIH
jgi:hypothetical protein